MDPIVRQVFEPMTAADGTVHVVSITLTRREVVIDMPAETAVRYPDGSFARRQVIPISGDDHFHRCDQRIADRLASGQYRLTEEA